MAKEKKKSSGGAWRSLLPRRKAELRQIELLGGVAMFLLVGVIGGVFFLTTQLQLLHRLPHVAAVVTGVLVDLTNGDRAANGLSSLTVNPQLVAIAQAKANDMATKGYFAHVSPEGHEPWYWFRQGGYAFEYAGENLAVDFTDSMDVERAWMNSPTHRKNILDSNYTEIGIATAVGTYQGRSTIFVAQVFGKPAANKVQSPLTSATIPRNPSDTAVAAAVPRPSQVVPAPEQGVLGSSAPEDGAATPVAQPTVAAELAVAAMQERPYWSGLVSFPRETLRTLYIALAFLILLALAIDTGLEVRWHHRRRAARAGALLLIMLTLFAVAELYMFAEPVIAFADAASEF